MDGKQRRTNTKKTERMWCVQPNDPQNPCRAGAAAACVLVRSVNSPSCVMYLQGEEEESTESVYEQPADVLGRAKSERVEFGGVVINVPDPGQCGVARLFDNLEIPDLDTGNGEVAGSRWTLAREQRRAIPWREKEATYGISNLTVMGARLSVSSVRFFLPTC